MENFKQVKATAIIIISILKVDKFQHDEKLKPQNRLRWTAADRGQFFDSTRGQKHEGPQLRSDPDPAKIQLAENERGASAGL